LNKMAGILIYKDLFEYYNIVMDDNLMYECVKKGLIKNKNKIIWEKGNVDIQKIEEARDTKNLLVQKLNAGEAFDLEKELKELDKFFE